MQDNFYDQAWKSPILAKKSYKSINIIIYYLGYNKYFNSFNHIFVERK